MTMSAPQPELASAASGSLGTYTFVDEEELLGALPLLHGVVGAGPVVALAMPPRSLHAP